MARPAARHLILDLLSTLPRGAMPVRALVDAGRLFGIEENALRVALTRLGASGLVESDERGLYRLGSGAMPVSAQVAAWRTVEQAVRPWDGGWVGVHTAAVGRADRTALRRRLRALRFLGFREPSPGLEVRPDNLVGGVAAVRERLHGLGLEPAVPVFGLHDLDADTAARAVRLWDSDALRAAYRATRAELEASARRLSALAPEAAMAESFLVGGRAIRQIVLDPLLPEPIVPARERAALVDAMRRYDRLGRDCWSGFMRRAGVTRRHTPADVRIIDTRAAFAPAGDLA